MPNTSVFWYCKVHLAYFVKMWKLGFVAKTCLYSSNQGRPTVYPLGISTGTLVVSRQLLPECKHEYMLECAGATTFVRCCYIYCKWRLFQQTNITANVSHLAMTRFTRFGQMFFSNISVCMLYTHMNTFTLTSCHRFPQGAGGVLCERKHLQGEAEAFLHQKPKVK